MDTQLRELRRNATTKEDTLELLARAGRAGSEALHYDTHAALDKFPTDRDIVSEWMDAHCKAIIYTKSNFLSAIHDGRSQHPGLHAQLWVYGDQGKHQLNANGEFVQTIIVDKDDIHLVGSQTQENQFRSLFARTTQSAPVPPGGRVAAINDIVTTSEGTFVRAYSANGTGGVETLSGNDLITNLTTGETKSFPYERDERARVHPSIEKLFSFEGKLAYALTQNGNTRFTGWNGESWTKKKQKQAERSQEMRLGSTLRKPEEGMYQPFANGSWRYFPLEHETIQKTGYMMRGTKPSREAGVTAAEPISQHFYEKLLRQYGG